MGDINPAYCCAKPVPEISRVMCAGTGEQIEPNKLKLLSCVRVILTLTLSLLQMQSEVQQKAELSPGYNQNQIGFPDI